MAKNCMLCGKKLKVTEYFNQLENADRVKKSVCSECMSKHKEELKKVQAVQREGEARKQEEYQAKLDGAKLLGTDLKDD